MSDRLIDFFESQVRRRGDNNALIHGNTAVTYLALNQLANKIANEILRHECRGSSIAGIALDHGIERIACSLGILKAWLGYFAVDLSQHDNHLSESFRHTRCSFVICSSKDQHRIKPLLYPGCQLILFESCEDSGCPTISSAQPNEIDYIRYTSGTTGAPKGIVHSRQTAIHLARVFSDTVGLRADDRVSLFNTFWHTLIHGTLISGATLCLFDLKQSDHKQMGNWLDTEQITILSTFPTAFRKFCASLKGVEGFTSVRSISLSGEILTATDISLVKKHFSAECNLINSYGCSEFAHIACCSMEQKVNAETYSVPTGNPSASSHISIIDSTNESTNGAGEIVVYNPYMTSGYLGMDTLTDKVYVKDSKGKIIGVHTGDYGYIDEHDCLYVLGRKDRRVKVKGFLVSLDEIETTLKQHPSVNEAVVCAYPTVENDHWLAAFISPANKQISQSELRVYLASRMSSQMLPKAYIECDEMPLLPSGKVDVTKFSEMSEDEMVAHQLRLGFVPRENYLAPRNDLEVSLSRIWESVLNIRPIGMSDDFFELGGDSLTATQVLSRVHDAFRIRLPLSSIFKASALADMANLVAQEVNS